MTMKQIYLGGGVYLDYVDEQLVLTKRGRVVNTIVLEADAYNQLLQCVAALKRAGAAEEYS